MAFTYEYPRPAVSVDMVVLRVIDGVQKVLLIRRLNDPFKGQWSLPGGFLDMNETLEQAAARELMEETSLTATSATCIGAFSDVDRDPRTRVIAVAFRMEVDEAEQPVAGDDAADTRWCAVSELPELAFDHSKIMAVALCEANSS